MESPENKAKPAPNVVLYTRRGCHLCEEAYEFLTEHEIRHVVVDIDTDPELQNRFGAMVPVIEIGGRIRFHGRINRVLLRRELGHR